MGALQVMGILSAMLFVRFGLEPLVKLMRRLFVAPGSWEKSSEYYILREVCFYVACMYMSMLLCSVCMIVCMLSRADDPCNTQPLDMSYHEHNDDNGL